MLLTAAKGRETKAVHGAVAVHEWDVPPGTG